MNELTGNSWWIFVILGTLAGVLSGMLGVGSGALVIPALVILCSFPQKSAQGTALAIMVPMAIVSFIRYKLNPDIEINLTVVDLLTIGAIFGALIGSELAMRLPGHLLRDTDCAKVFAQI